VAFFDLPLEQLRTYAPARVESADFDSFWARTLSEARQHPLNVTFAPVDFGLSTLETFDVTFNGFGGQPIKGWLLLPKNRVGKIPGVVEFIGYGGGRAFPIDWLTWASTGYAHLVMDTRGQGSTWGSGDTADIEPAGSNPQHPGFMTRGILNPDTYYYRRVFTDGVRAIEAMQSHSAVDADRIAVTGGSQGGGIAIAVAGLAPQAVKVAMPDVPFLCHYRRATEVTNRDPYGEISRYCVVHRTKVEQVFETLSYFDGVNLGTRANAQALFSVGLMDDICPPSTVFAAFNHYKGAKDIRVWTYNNHEGGGNYQTIEKIKFLTGLWPVN
jgi:cephalosporin-C deacetylase